MQSSSVQTTNNNVSKVTDKAKIKEALLKEHSTANRGILNNITETCEAGETKGFDNMEKFETNNSNRYLGAIFDWVDTVLIILILYVIYLICSRK